MHSPGSSKSQGSRGTSRAEVHAPPVLAVVLVWWQLAGRRHLPSCGVTAHCRRGAHLQQKETHMTCNPFELAEAMGILTLRATQ